MINIGFILLLLVGCVLAIAVVLSVAPKRNKKINLIIRDLEKLRSSAPEDMQYAINENIIFFKNIKTIYGYVYWGIGRRRSIDPDKLLEVADLPLPRWEKELYEDLAHVESKEFPGLSKPLRKLLLNHIEKNKNSIMLDLGCGSMEVERQVLINLKKHNVNTAPIFVGVDSAPQAFDAIKSNFADIDDIKIKELTTLDGHESLTSDKPTIYFYCGDALEIADVHGHKYNLIFSSRFRHHLTSQEKAKIDSISQRITHFVIEYDDYRTNLSWIPPVLTAWYRPVLLSAANFSQIRQPQKKEIIKAKKRRIPNTKVYIYSPPGSYSKIYMRDTETVI
jgi:hypothetical protein